MITTDQDRALLWVLTDDWRHRADTFAALCDELADLWPGQNVRADGYSEGARVANHLRIVAATVRGAARRIEGGRR